jgi:hypothetical protein
MASPSDTQLVVNVSTAVLGAETNATRFEGFCRAVVSKIEGDALIFSTSASWDLGRDGVGAGRASGLYVCCSLRDDVDSKALSDIQRLASTTQGIKRVYFCSNHSLSEHRRTTIEKTLLEEVDDAFEIVCLGIIQILEAARQYDAKIIQNYYGVEISNTLRAVRPDLSSETEIRGLRLALISSAADDSSAIRSEVYRNALLDVLKDSKRRTSANISKDVSESLRLQRNIAEAALQPHLDALTADGLVALNGTAYSISALGIQSIAKLEEEAALRLLSGRQAVRDALSSALGTQLLTDHFDRVWTIFEEKMAQYFMARGDALVAEISELIVDDGDATKVGSMPSTLSFLEDLADAVAATSSHVQQREELRVAVKDLFSDRTSVATNWLVRVCASFVAACALGLEHSSNLALEKLLAKTTLVLDTDVMLSLLGTGEPEHKAVETIVSRWTGFGGKVLVGEPVLEEVAYHAHIAQQDYDAVANRLPGTADDRLHIIENVFVRSFAELMFEKKVRPIQWRSFIGQFKGLNSRDWSTVFGMCHLTIRSNCCPRDLPRRQSWNSR